MPGRTPCTSPTSYQSTLLPRTSVLPFTHPLRTKPLCFPPAVSHLVIPIISRRFPIVFPVLIVTSPFLLLRLPSLPVSCPATTRSIALAFPSCSSPWFLVYPDPFPVASPAFPNSDRVSLEHIQEPYLHPDLQATLRLRSVIGLFTGCRRKVGPHWNQSLLH